MRGIQEGMPNGGAGVEEVEAVKEVAEAESLDKKLTPEEVSEYLKSLEDYLKKIEDSGIEPVFPQGHKIGEEDVSGVSLRSFIERQRAKLSHYEPPVMQEVIKQEEVEIVESNIPKWLEGHENLIWQGAYENPIWEVNSQQYDKEVVISYERRGHKLKPGKTKYEQKRELEAIDNSFTLDEWRIAKVVFAKYQNLEKALQGNDSNVKKEAKSILRKIIKEENDFRKGKSEEPKIIKELVEKTTDEVSKQTRGFKKENIDLDKLTQKIAEALSQLVVLNFTRGEGKEKIPKEKTSIKEIPSFRQSLEKLSDCLATQLGLKEEGKLPDEAEFKANDKDWHKSFENAKGISLIIGEAGTGKNEMLEYFAAKTNRPFFWFPCGRGMEAIDLVTHYEFDSKEGTQRFMTNLAEGIQTPGAIVMVDEVNALKPEVQAILHGLGDSNRSLNYDGINIPVAEGAVIVLAGNPATYGSAGSLGEALLSRSAGQSMVMDYPALTKGELIAREKGWDQSKLEQEEQVDNTLKDLATDEALVLFPLINELKGLTDEKFTLLWELVVNEAHAQEVVTQIELDPELNKISKNKDIVKILEDLRSILKIADEWRKNFQKKTGGFDQLGLSLRDTIAIVNAYTKTKDVKRAFLETTAIYKKEPIEGLDTLYKSLEELINKQLSPAS